MVLFQIKVKLTWAHNTNILFCFTNKLYIICYKSYPLKSINHC